MFAWKFFFLLKKNKNQESKRLFNKNIKFEPIKQKDLFTPEFSVAHEVYNLFIRNHEISNYNHNY